MLINTQRRAQVLDVEPEDQVLLKNHQKLSKLTPTYAINPYEVMEKKGNALILKGEDGSIKMRNSSHVKKFGTIPEHLQFHQSDFSANDLGESPPISDDDGAVSQPVPNMQKPSKPPEPPDNTKIKSSPRPQRERQRPGYLDSYELYWTQYHNGSGISWTISSTCDICLMPEIESLFYVVFT